MPTSFLTIPRMVGLLALGAAMVLAGWALAIQTTHPTHGQDAGPPREQRTFCYVFSVHDPKLNANAEGALGKLLEQGWVITSTSPLGGAIPDAWASLMVLERPRSHPAAGGGSTGAAPSGPLY